ncbi:hypothetical protein P8C59_001008 [Phyllachora maydis]|uniref:Uncharacterized protein n=1 Tax=Phyllachora maydis TaxID=1825666 RepID=A0AAD9HYT2_9PEZI|nr:hypothetical protein P8C59_001008 [Phyllachora maydis]
MWKRTPLASIFLRMSWPTSKPKTRSHGAFSMPMTATSLPSATAPATSMPMKEEPTMTILLRLASPTAAVMLRTSPTLRSVKMLPSTWKPCRGRALGVAPVASTSLP